RRGAGAARGRELPGRRLAAGGLHARRDAGAVHHVCRGGGGRAGRPPRLWRLGAAHRRLRVPVGRRARPAPRPPAGGPRWGARGRVRGAARGVLPLTTVTYGTVGDWIVIAERWRHVGVARRLGAWCRPAAPGTRGASYGRGRQVLEQGRGAGRTCQGVPRRGSR